MIFFIITCSHKVKSESILQLNDDYIFRTTLF